MNLLGLFIVFIYIGAAVTPIAGTYITYNDNIEEMIIPPEVQDMVTNIIGDTPTSNSIGSTENTSIINFAEPEYIGSSYDLADRTVTAIFRLSNPLNMTLTVNQVSADVKCHAHGFLLGQAEIPEAEEIPPGQTSDLTVVFTWTETAQEHFLSSHLEETTVNVDLVNIVINVSGLTIETPLTYNLDVPLT